MWLLLAPAALAFDLAVTIDDVPWQRGVPPEGVPRATERLLAHLTSRGVPVTGFVNCGKPDQDVLAAWIAAGAELGNHTWSHADADKVPAEEWVADARRCHEALEARGLPVRWFRHPYLREGRTPEQHAAVAAGVEAMGVRVGRVSVDNLEWKLAFWYQDALDAGDAARAGEIATAYVAHVREAVAHYREVGRAKTGREIAQVLLLHANSLAADRLGALLDGLSADGATFVTLEAAMADPVYALPDAYVGPAGMSWLHHVVTDVGDSEWDDAQWRTLTARFDPR